MSSDETLEYRALVNIARDVADSFHRFDRDWQRFCRMVKAADNREVSAALLEACAGNEKRMAAMNQINERLRALQMYSDGE